MPLSTPAVERFAFDDDNVEKFWAHGLTPEQVSETLYHVRRIRRNRKARRAPYLLIGRDHQGRCIAIPIEPTHDPTTWYPVTAWFCKPSEWALLP